MKNSKILAFLPKRYKMNEIVEYSLIIICPEFSVPVKIENLSHVSLLKHF